MEVRPGLSGRGWENIKDRANVPEVEQLRRIRSIHGSIHEESDEIAPSGV